MTDQLLTGPIRSRGSVALHNSRLINFDLSFLHLLAAISILMNLFRTYERTGDMPAGRDVLISAIEQSQSSAYWHMRLTFQLAQLHAHPRVLDYHVRSLSLSSSSSLALLSSAPVSGTDSESALRSRQITPSCSAENR